MSASLKAKIADVFDEPGCDKNQGKSEKDRKKGCTKQLAPGAAAGGCAFDGAKIALQPIVDVAHLVHGPIACEGNSWDNRHSASSGSQLYRTGFTTDINELDVIYGGEKRLFKSIREIIENLVHAHFRDALVSVLSNGHIVRVSDSGPGIPDSELAMQPGFTTAGPQQRTIIRGVGCGLPLAASVMDAEGGTIEFGRNLAGGTVVTLTTPSPMIEDDSEHTVMLAEDDRLVMALLLEMGPSLPERLAVELSWTVGRCGRELVVLESRGLVCRDSDGRRSLTPNGSRLLATLF